MADIQVKITNLPQIKRAFSMAPQIMTRNLSMAIRQTVLSISRESRQRTPVDTGRLRASTYERFSSFRGEVGTNTEYDVFVHEGTKFMRGRPYLRNAVGSTPYQQYFDVAVQNTLNQIGKMT